MPALTVSVRLCMKKKPIPVTGAVFAAGGVVFNDEGRVAVIHRPQYDDWCLPKGKLEKGEDALVAAVREVWEETGCIAAPERFLGTLCYTIKGKPKWVFYWRMRVDSAEEFSPNSEVDQLVWLTLGGATRRLQYRGERDMLRLAARK